jgi:hypothetical protein
MTVRSAVEMPLRSKGLKPFENLNEVKISEEIAYLPLHWRESSEGTTLSRSADEVQETDS